MKAVNLLPNDLRRATRAPSDTARAGAEPAGPGPFVVLGALALSVVALAGYVLTTNAIEDRRAELERVTAETRLAAQRAAELKPYADFDTMAKTRVQTVRDLAASRFDWEQALRDVSRAIPANVTLTYLDGSVSSESAGGGSALRSAITSPAIELKGCTTDQPAVATLMSRLRSVDGVTRVSLTKSVKPEATATAAQGMTPTGCGAGRPPAFELVLFFERSTVPATVEDITVAPEAAPAEDAPAGETAPESTPASAEEEPTS